MRNGRHVFNVHNFVLDKPVACRVRLSKFTKRGAVPLVKFPRIHISLVYRFIQIRSGQTILRKEFCESIPISRRTLSRALKFLEKRGYIAIDGKKFYDTMN